MSKMRNIAAILGRTEAANVDNSPGVDLDDKIADSSVVSSILAGSTMAVFSSVDSLPGSPTAGSQAFVIGNQRLYTARNSSVGSGSGWYNVALINATPTLSLSASGTIALTAGSATVITMTAADSDNSNANLALTLESGGDLFKFATVSQDSSVVTITPRTADSATALGSDGSATLTFKASDGISQATVQNTFTLSFGPDWTVSATETIVRASDAQIGDGLGSASISKDSNYLITGVGDEDGGSGDVLGGSGAAYIYTRSGTSWTEQAILRPSDKAANDAFGWFVDINNDGTYAVISTVYKNNAAGAAYVFTRSGSTWTQQAKLTAEGNAANSALFGYEVAINGDGSYIIIGAQGENSSGGTVYIFARSGTSWSRQHREAAAGTNKRLGFSVSISESGTYAASSQLLGGTGGEAYVLTRSGSTWTMGSAITPSDVASSDQFGVSVAIEDDYLLVGSRNDDDGGDASGSAYVFTRSGSTWSQQAKLVASDDQAGDQFGESVTMSQDTNYVAIGSPDEDGSSANVTGAVYVFERSGSTWTQRQKLVASAQTANDKLGEEVSISGDGSFVVGVSPADDGSGDSLSQVGAAYVFNA